MIKVYDHLPADVYQAIIETAQKKNIPVVGHVPFAIGLDGVLESGQHTIEHLTGYIDPDEVEFIIPEDRLDEYARKTKLAGVWNCVTLSEYPKSKETPEGFQRLQNQPGMIYVSPGTCLLSPFLYLMSSKSHTYAGVDYPQRIAVLNRQMVGSAARRRCRNSARNRRRPSLPSARLLQQYVIGACPAQRIGRVEDVADAVVASLHSDTVGKTFDCVGPDVMTLADLVRAAGRDQREQHPIIPLPMALGRLQARLMETAPGEPLMSRDNLDAMSVDNIASGQWPDLSALGIAVSGISAVAPTYLSGPPARSRLLSIRDSKTN